MMAAWKQRVRQLKTETFALYLAYKDPRTPWYARLLTVFVVAHTFSPIDLIPDFIPVLGYLDDLIITPLGIALAVRLIPPQVLAECREQARATMARGKPTSWAGTAVVVAIWLVVVAGAALLAWRAIVE